MTRGYGLDSFLPWLIVTHKTYPSDRAHRMPIITPAYPSVCSAGNIRASQRLKNLTEVLYTFSHGFSASYLGREIVERILFGKTAWDELWAKHDFFHRYHNYLQVVASAVGLAKSNLKFAN